LRADEFVYDPTAPDFQDRIYDVYNRLREDFPCYHNEALGFYAVSRFRDVWQIMGDHQHWSSEGVAEGASLLPQFIYLDPPRHHRLRELVSRAFTPGRVAGLEDRIRQVAGRLVDVMAEKAGGDLVRDLAVPLPATIMGELIGVPPERLEHFISLAEGFLGVTDPEQIAEPAARIYEVFTGLMVERRAQPQDDLMSALLGADVDGQRLTEDELLGFCFLLLVAGNDTTTSLIGTGALLLADHPDQRQELVADRGLLRDAIEEMLRYESPTQVIPRVAREDRVIHGVRVPAGARMQLTLGAANRDEREFAQGHRFDIRRKVRRSVAFGVGLHFCIGAPLARIEARIAFDELLSKMPNYALTAPPERIRSNWARSLGALPVGVG
jgi:cytochrome P450